MTGTYELASLPQQSINRWHDFVATGDPERLSPLLAKNIVFCSPFVQAPIPGHAGPADGRRGDGNRIGPQLARLEEAAAGQ